MFLNLLPHNILMCPGFRQSKKLGKSKKRPNLKKKDRKLKRQKKREKTKKKRNKSKDRINKIAGIFLLVGVGVTALVLPSKPVKAQDNYWPEPYFLSPIKKNQFFDKHELDSLKSYYMDEFARPPSGIAPFKRSEFNSKLIYSTDSLNAANPWQSKSILDPDNKQDISKTCELVDKYNIHKAYANYKSTRKKLVDFFFKEYKLKQTDVSRGQDPPMPLIIDHLSHTDWVKYRPYIDAFKDADRWLYTCMEKDAKEFAEIFYDEMGRFEKELMAIPDSLYYKHMGNSVHTARDELG